MPLKYFCLRNTTDRDATIVMHSSVTTRKECKFTICNVSWSGRFLTGSLIKSRTTSYTQEKTET